MIIANLFYRLELIEAYGTGIQRIMESYESCLQKPIFKPAPASFVVTLPKMDYNASALENCNLSREELVLKTFGERGVLTRRDVELLLGQSKFSAIQILNKLCADGKIVKTGAAKSVKYHSV
jgi:ATP-dependent DNA helicase RecG